MEDEQLKRGADLSISPLLSRFAGHEKASADAPFLQNRRVRILCVDDEILGTQIRGDILEQHGYEVVIYHRPSEVLNGDLSIFDLGVLDFEIPGLNGRELLLRMRALGADFPVVLLSGYADFLPDEDRDLFDSCIDKTRPIQYLLDSIAELLNPNRVGRSIPR
jgi:CheY-like chemotaxis protein